MDFSCLRDIDRPVALTVVTAEPFGLSNCVSHEFTLAMFSCEFTAVLTHKTGHAPLQLLLPSAMSYPITLPFSVETVSDQAGQEVPGKSNVLASRFICRPPN